VYFHKGEKSESSLEELKWKKWSKLDGKALYGFAGKFVAPTRENSEADPAAVLVTSLTRFGVECGPGDPILWLGMLNTTLEYLR